MSQRSMFDSAVSARAKPKRARVNRTLVPAQRSIFDLPIGPAVAVFFLMSAIAHAGGPLARRAVR